jgi:hypothetical protein
MSANQPTPDQTLTYRGKPIVRAIGTILLTACALMVVLGVTVFSNSLHGLRYATYWSWCFLLTTAAIIVALWDMLMLRRAGKQTRRQLFREQFMTPDLLEKLQKKDDGKG